MAPTAVELPANARTLGGAPQAKATAALKRSNTPTPKAATAKASPKVAAAPSTKDDKGLRGISEGVLRAAFLKKVYSLLACQLLFTVAVAATCMHVQFIRTAFLSIAESQSRWVRLAFNAPSLVSLLVLYLGAKDKYPANYICLFFFTLGMSLNISFVCSIVHAVGYGHLILQAVGATSVIFLGLTAYVYYSGKNFSYLGGFLAIALWGLVTVGIGAIFFPSMTSSLLYGFAGALTFCGYILYDTWRLQEQFSYDDFIGATIEIYLDVVNLFLYILDILIKLNKKKDD